MSSAKTFDFYLKEIRETGGDYSRASVSLDTLRELSEDYDKAGYLLVEKSKITTRALGIYNNLRNQIESSKVSKDENVRLALSELEKTPLMERILKYLEGDESPKHLKDSKEVKRIAGTTKGARV